ncbi:ABC transporter substrate-binding protein [Dehalococcoidia bacterium]|nr:ABC transporter substrate-binding protein [Dehalococcoidia bacterium]
MAKFGIKRLVALVSSLAVLALVAGACGGADPTSVPAPTAVPQATPVPAAAKPTVAPAAAPITGARAGSYPNVNARDLGPVNYRSDQVPDFSLNAQPGGTIRLFGSGAWPHFDPSFATASGMNQAVSAVYSRLTRCAGGVEVTARPYDPYGCEVVPALAEKWDISSSGTVFTFHLREGVKFHNIAPVNGRELTSDDIVFSYDHYMNPDGPAGGINRAVFNLVTDVEAVDRYTVKITISDPFPEFLQSTTSQRQSYILPREILDADGDYKTQAIGTGPMQHSEINGKQRIRFDKHPDYFKEGRPFIDAFEFSIVKDNATKIAGFRAGLTDYLARGQTVSSAKEVAKSQPQALVYDIAKDLAQFVFYMKLDQEPFSDVRVRRAMSLAMDRPSIVKDIYSDAAVIQSPVLFGMWGERPGLDKMPWYNYDIAQAKKLMAEAGLSDGFEVDVNYYSRYLEVRSAMPIWLEGLKELNIKLNLQGKDRTAFNALLRSGTYKIASTGFQSSQSSVHGWVYNQLHSSSGANFGKINIPELDALLEAQQIELDPEARKKILQDIWQYEVDNVLRIPFPTAAQIWFYQPHLHNVLHNFQYLFPHVVSTTFEYLWLER